MGYVALFFVVNHRLLLHKCNLQMAEKSGDFLNYPYSHDAVWMKCYQQRFHKDYDYFPRGRIVYNMKTDTYMIYADKCLNSRLDSLIKDFSACRVTFCEDEHYQCHRCSRNYNHVFAR